MYSFASEKQWFWDGNEHRQFWTSGVRDLDPPPLGKAKCTVLQRKSSGFAMAMKTGNFGLRGSGA